MLCECTCISMSECTRVFMFVWASVCASLCAFVFVYTCNLRMFVCARVQCVYICTCMYMHFYNVSMQPRCVFARVCDSVSMCMQGIDRPTDDMFISKQFINNNAAHTRVTKPHCVLHSKSTTNNLPNTKLSHINISLLNTPLNF